VRGRAEGECIGVADPLFKWSEFPGPVRNDHCLSHRWTEEGHQVKPNKVIRLSSGLKDIDAIQIKNGARYAIKTIGTIPQTTSNLWAKVPGKVVDFFVINRGLYRQTVLNRGAPQLCSR
jgi:hypothetical protein